MCPFCSFYQLCADNCNLLIRFNFNLLHLSSFRLLENTFITAVLGCALHKFDPLFFFVSCCMHITFSSSFFYVDIDEGEHLAEFEHRVSLEKCVCKKGWLWGIIREVFNMYLFEFTSLNKVDVTCIVLCSTKPILCIDTTKLSFSDSGSYLRQYGSFTQKM